MTIVQHPREAKHAFGTARLVELSLERSRILVDHLGQLRRDASALGTLEGAALLYPHASARDVTTLPIGDRPSQLIVIDGTWHHAKTLYRDVAPLRSLPHLSLPEDLRSDFRLRRQPRRECLSTLEAVAYALDALEPETQALGPLLATFEAMQARQLALPRCAGRKRRRRRDRASRALPRALVERFSTLVVVYAESAPSEGGRRLLSLSAQRPATGESFFGLVQRTGLSSAHLTHLGHRRDEIEAAADESRLRERWTNFLRPDDELASWNGATPRLLDGAGLPHCGGVLLKSAYHNLRRSRGSLEAILAAEKLTTPAREGHSTRAKRRLERAVVLARFLHAHATQDEARPSAEAVQ